VIGSASSEAAAPLLRRGLLGLAGLTILGLAVELAVERHWTQPLQLVAWAALAVGGLAAALLLGIWEHIEGNHDAGGLDRNYMDTWDDLPSTTQWWLAISKTVGPSPPLAPGALAQVGLCVLLATLRHPALTRR